MTAKIDEVHQSVKRMEADLHKLEAEQQQHFQETLEKASAAILAEFRKEINNLKELISSCPCNKEILAEIRKQKPEKEKAEPSKAADKTVADPGKPRRRTGWYPETLDPKEFPFRAAKWE